MPWCHCTAAAFGPTELGAACLWGQLQDKEITRGDITGNLKNEVAGEEYVCLLTPKACTYC